MTPDTTPTAARTRRPSSGVLDVAEPATLRRTVASELVKLRTLRSTRLLLLSAAVCVVGFGLAEAVGVVVVGSADGLADPLKGSLNGVGVAQLLVLGLGVSAATSEYASGTIATTLTTQPRRGVLAAGKATAVGVATAAAAAAAVITSFAANSLVLTDQGLSSWPSPDVWRALLGATLYLTCVAMLGTAFGHLLRSTAGAYAAAAGLLYLPALLVLLLPPDAGARVTRYTPANSGSALMQLEPGALLPWLPALAVLLGHLVTVSVCAAARLQRHDV